MEQAIIMLGFIDCYCYVHGWYDENTEKGTIASFQKFAQAIPARRNYPILLSNYYYWQWWYFNKNFNDIYQDYIKNYNKEGSLQARQIGDYLEEGLLFPIILKLKVQHDETLITKTKYSTC